MARTIISPTLGVLCLLQTAFAAPSNVRAIHSQVELDAAISQYEAVMVDYESPYCSHCKRMKYAYEQAADFLIEHNILLATVNCLEWTLNTAGNPMCEGVRSYPTIMVYGNDREPVKYTSGRKARDFILYMTNGTYPDETHSLTTSTTSISTSTTQTATPISRPDYTVPNAVYIGPNGTFANVKLALPGLPYFNNLELSSAAIFEIQFSPDGKHLVVNEQPLALQVPDPSHPADLTAAQVAVDWDLSTPGYGLTTSYSRRISLHRTGGIPELGLDYELYAHNRDDPGIVYYNYHPTIYLNLIGASAQASASYPDGDFLLDSLEQKIIEISLDQLGGGSSADPNRTYRISGINFLDRPENYHVPRPDDYICHSWSWRCSDVSDPPWYRFVWRRNFDGFGRIGSLRWRLDTYKWDVIAVLGTMLHHGLPWLPIAFVAAWAFVFFVVIGKRRMVEQRGRFDDVKWEKKGKK